MSNTLMGTVVRPSEEQAGETVIAVGQYHLLTIGSSNYTVWSFAMWDGEPYIWSPQTFMHVSEHDDTVVSFHHAAEAFEQHEERAIAAAVVAGVAP